MIESLSLPTLGLELPGATYFGPTFDDIDLAEAIPLDIGALMEDVNGFIAFHGALHVRGISAEPSWHSLRAAWKGERALHRLFPALLSSDIPFAQDALGNQFVFRDDRVWNLHGETGELHSAGLDLQDWLAAVIEAPHKLLPIAAIEQFRADGEDLLPGYLLSAYPPFCTAESASGVALRAIPAAQRIAFLADFAAQLAQCPDDARIRISVQYTDET